jgi:multidrug resistance efflux pump
MPTPAPPQAQLDTARLNLAYTRVTAPIDGRVSKAEITTRQPGRRIHAC